MADAPEISGQESEIEKDEVISLAAELDAPDDDQPVDEKPGEDSTPKDEGTPEADKGGKDKEGEDEVETPVAVVDDAQLKLVQTIRQMRKDMALQAARVARQDAELERLRGRVKEVGAAQDSQELNGLEGDVVLDNPDDEALPLTDLEQLQYDLYAIGQERGESLTTIVEAMAVSPQYADVKEVCSRDNLNDLVDAIAAKVAKEQGVDPVLAALQVEKAIWNQPNPFAWMYHTLKEHHPKYRQASEKSKEVKDETPPAEKPKGREPKPAEAPGSVGGTGSADTGTAGGWTAARLDMMDDTEYSNVPQKIREQYLAGELP